VYTENRIAVVVMAAMTMFFCRNCSSSLHSWFFLWISKWEDTGRVHRAVTPCASLLDDPQQGPHARTT
jgi:hypothetical protein